MNGLSAFSSRNSMSMPANISEMGDPMSTPSFYSYIFPSNVKYVAVIQNSAPLSSLLSIIVSCLLGHHLRLVSFSV
uniref:Uncharacterized protein n=1 Tax=Trichobilharzia regenti TaxID=157069 RepID=A0AA85KEQ3_TRIRE|nr:unnamed protein product [Trichobilharzia regenti]